MAESLEPGALESPPPGIGALEPAGETHCRCRRRRQEWAGINPGVREMIDAAPFSSRRSLRDCPSCFSVKSGRRDLNPRPLDPQSSALAKLRYAPNRHPSRCIRSADCERRSKRLPPAVNPGNRRVSTIRI